jgi:2-phospho-L-lactate guanylyltransferase
MVRKGAAVPGTWAVVPIKAFERAKSRLASVLPDPERVRLARGLFDHVLSVLGRCRDLDGILVITDSPTVAELASARATVIREPVPSRTLGHTVDAALAQLASLGAGAALVLMADLPHLEPADVSQLLALLRANDVVVAPDAHERGTNALGLTPPNVLSTCFGRPDSFACHCAAARHAGLRLQIHRSSRLAFDLDAPEDLARL